MDVSSIAAIVLGLTFWLAALGKLRDPRGFVLAVLEYDILPVKPAIVYGRVLPLIELACGVVLLLGVWPVAAGLAAAVLLLTFTLGVSVNLVRKRRLACHCFGANDSEVISWTTLARLVVLLTCSGLVVFGRSPGLLMAPSADLLPGFLSAVGAVFWLHFLSVVPDMLDVWRLNPVAGATLNGGRISLKVYPLVGHGSEPSPDGLVAASER